MPTDTHCRACRLHRPAEAMGHVLGEPTCAPCLSALVQAAEGRLHRLAERLADARRENDRLLVEVAKHAVTPEQARRDMTADDIAIERARRKAKR